MRWQEWIEAGQWTPTANGRLWNRMIGTGLGPATTLLHGFPTNSRDWHLLLERLPAGRRRLVVDLLGYGASDKPVAGFDDQVDALVELWRAHNVDTTVLVCHDYSVSIAQTILARITAGEWDGPRITAAVLLNGGLFYSQQKRLPIQGVLASPVGPLVASMMGEGRFRRTMARICRQPIGDEELHEAWVGLAEGGTASVARAGRYHGERRDNESKWTAALNYAQVPVTLLWGDADPISGAPMAEHAARRCNNLQIARRSDLGHYPHLEDPDWVARWVARVERRSAAPREIPDPIVA